MPACEGEAVTVRPPCFDDVCPDWRELQAELGAAAEASRVAPSGWRKRVATKRAAALQKEWNLLHHEVRKARLAAGWIPVEGGMAWLYQGEVKP